MKLDILVIFTVGLFDILVDFYHSTDYRTLDTVENLIQCIFLLPLNQQIDDFKVPYS